MRNGQQSGQPRRTAQRHPVAVALGWWLAIFFLWLLYVDTLEPAELLVGVAASALAALAPLAIYRHGGLRFRPRLRWLTLLAHVPREVLRDSAIVLAALWRRLVRQEQVHGAFRRVPFAATGDDAEQAAWRGVAVAVTSIAPNTYVLGIDADEGYALIHQLVPQAPDEVRSSVVGAE